MAKKVYIPLAEGFEEVEALTAVDVMRRAGADAVTVSLGDADTVTGAHGVAVRADLTWAKADGCKDADCVMLPGGLPGATHLAAHRALGDLIIDLLAHDKYVAAICASPAMVLLPLGVLDHRQWTGYPGCEPAPAPRGYTTEAPVVSDDRVITGIGPAWALDWALATVQRVIGIDESRKVAQGMLYGMF